MSCDFDFLMWGFAILVVVIVIAACWKWYSSKKSLPSTQLVEVDPMTLEGRWYAHAHIPSWFEPANMTDVQAEYRWDAKTQQLDIVNSGRVNGQTIQAHARGSPSGLPGELSVRFDGVPQPGSYQVLYKNDSKTAPVLLVGNAERDKLWLMTRSPQRDSATFSTVVHTGSKAAEHGYTTDTMDKIRWVTHGSV